MRIGILECGVPPADVVARHGDFADAVRAMLGRDATVYAAMHGVLPASPTDCDAYVVTGSPAGVMDDPALDRPAAVLPARRARAARLVGLCFGHQAMAAAFGGRVEKSDRGWGLGLHGYEVVARAPWMDDAATIRIPAFHQDQVVAAPVGARVTLASPFTPFAGLDYGDAVSFQCHPEFSLPYAVALTEALRPKLGVLTDPALASYAAPDDVARVQGWIGRFLRRGLMTRTRLSAGRIGRPRGAEPALPCRAFRQAERLVLGPAEMARQTRQRRHARHT